MLGLSAELINPKKHLKPLLCVGFHKAQIFSFIVLFLFLISMVNTSIGIILSITYFLFFLLNTFVVIHYSYDFSIKQSFMTLFNLILIFTFILMVISFFYEDLFIDILLLFY